MPEFFDHTPPQINADYDLASSDDVLRYAQAAFDLEDEIFSSIIDPAQTLHEQGEPWRLPLAFYYNHSAAFYMNKARRAGLTDTSVDPELERRFARGVDVKDPRDLRVRKGRYGDISLERMQAFRANVRDTVMELIQKARIGDGPINWDDPRWALFMGMEHQLIHGETTMALLRGLPTDQLREPASLRSMHPQKVSLSPKKWVPIEECGVTRITNREKYPYYAWDNEFGSYDVDVNAFQAASDFVSNGDFLEFVMEGGYKNPELWSDEGKAWLARFGMKHPRYWLPQGNSPDVRTPTSQAHFGFRTHFTELDALPLDLPAELNHFEAEAFCKAQNDGSRLPTEPEYALLDDHKGINQGSGNLWHLIDDRFSVFKGFKKHKLYPNFSPVNDPAQRVVLGGSYLTTGAQANNTYRLWMYPPFGHQQPCGLRMVRPA